MKCVCMAGAELIESEIPQPKPGAGEVRVHAAGVTPAELEWYPTSHTKSGEARTKAVPSHEFSGEIATTGDGVGEWPIGQEVYGMNDWFADGALAEFCITRPEWIAAKPERLTREEAASVAIGALTAWQGLLDRAKLQAGERVLIHGGAGAVGVFAIQLALSRGAYVITTVSSQNAGFVKSLGAVFDTVDGDTFQRRGGHRRPAFTGGAGLCRTGRQKRAR